MPVIRVKCVNPKCNTTVTSNTDKWSSEKKMVTIICPACKQPIEKQANPNYAKKNDTEIINPENKNKLSQPENDCAGWLIDKTTKKVYSLRLGKQSVGRGTSNRPSDIALETNDLTISGGHCIIETKTNGKGVIDYTISDNNSKNGVIVNDQKKLAADDNLYLSHLDTITIGRSLFILLSIQEVKTEQDALAWIQKKIK